jgi:predicted metalloprotease with PDZ domain
MRGWMAIILFQLVCITVQAQPQFSYTVKIGNIQKHQYHIELQTSLWNTDTVILKMPRWTPGYYQLLNYASYVENLFCSDGVVCKKLTDNSWQVIGLKNKPLRLSYDVKADKQFVAQSYLDSLHGYIVPAGVFLHAEGLLKSPVQIKLNINTGWKIATGLNSVNEKQREFSAPDFDILYDGPILMGNLEELQTFQVNGIPHRFIGYQMGTFDKALFMKNLQKVVQSAVDIINDIPFKEYTFIAIGPGRGGIEHLNNTTVSFDGNDLHSPQAMDRMMNFLAHEYFHNYNVKRIRPFELGPFDYDKGSRTNLLWVSEGLSVYYEYLIVKRAGLSNEQALYRNFEKNINATENNPGRLHQSLAQASYMTWRDGPFGKQGDDPNKSISYYDKGPIIGLLLDFSIRQATSNKKSLDDVMRILYWKYARKFDRGFTDAEFQQACEDVAGTALGELFEYVYTTKEIDYNTYLGFAGLHADASMADDSTKEKKYTISQIEKPGPLQIEILKSWLGK